MNRVMRYNFHEVEHCNMCGEHASTANILGRRMNLSQGFRPNKKAGIATTVVKCRSCGLVYSNPMPVPECMSQHYGITPESYWTKEYLAFNKAYFASQIDRFFSLYPCKTEALQALDIGAGVGKCMKALETRGFTAYGIEPSEPFYRRALELMEIQPTRLQMASIEEVQYADNIFDFVTFGAVLEHLYDPSKSISAALRWTKPGGLIQIEVPSADWLTNKISNLVYSLQGLDYVANISPMHRPFHLYEFTLQSFMHHAKANDYDIAFHDFHVASTFLPKILDPVIKPIMSVTKTGMQLEIWLRKRA
jgi:2-polyprenyl-3-methyl-5-hydroxy-6-metoxy-1,4-benzoquinol methylase